MHCYGFRTWGLWNSLKVFLLLNSFFVIVKKAPAALGLLQVYGLWKIWKPDARCTTLTRPDCCSMPFSILCFQTRVQVSPQCFIAGSEMSAFSPEVKWQFTSGSIWRGRPPSQTTSLHSPSQSFWSNWISKVSTKTPDLPDWTVMGQKRIQLKGVGRTEGRITVWLI